MDIRKKVNIFHNVYTDIRAYLSTLSRPLLWIAPLFFLAVFFFYPLSKIFALIFDPSTVTDVDNLRITYQALRFTFFQATLSTILTFILAMNAYATPFLLGGPLFKMMAPLVYNQFTQQANWPFGGAIAFILMTVTLILTVAANLIFQRRAAR